MSSPSPLQSPEPIKEKKKSKDKSKIKAKSPTITKEGKDEGTNAHWNYVPPEGTILLEHDVDCGEFDWDAVKNDEDVELWLLRVPEGVKPKYLKNVKIEMPSSSRNAIVGVLNRKQVSYDVWSVGDDDGQPIGGEEIRGLSCLLPRKKKKGELYKAPKPIARHLVISAQDITPTPNYVPSDAVQTHQNPPRQSYPKELLRHQFKPYGSLIENDNAGASQDMDVDMDIEKDTVKDGASPGKKSKELKGKKRKVEGDTPKKSKKAKTVV